MRALDRRAVAEHVAHGLSQGLGAVEHAEHPLGRVRAALELVGQEDRRHGGVLGRSLPQPERDLHPVRGDPERHDVGASLEIDAVEHQDGKAYVVEATGHQLGQGLAGALDEGARDHRLAHRARIGLDLDTNRLPSAPVAPARDPGEHPLEDDARERIAVGEVAVHGKADLAGAAGGGAYPGALDPDPPPAEGDLAGLVAVAHSSSLGVMAALGADDLSDLLFHQLGQAAQAEADRQG